MEKIMMMLLEVSLMMSILILVMIALKPFFNKKYGVKMRYFIWMFIALRLLIPINISFPEAIDIEISPRQTTFVIPTNFVANEVSINQEQIVNEKMSNPISLIEMKGRENSNLIHNDNISENKVDILPEKTLSLWNILFIIWILGFLLSASYQIVKYMQFYLLVKHTSHDCKQNLSSILQEIESKYKRHSEVNVVVNHEVSSPMLIGFVKPMIVLTNLELSVQQQKIILEHEFVHHIRHDLYFKLILIIVRCIHWFNPFVYKMVKEANRVIEFSCDEQVLAKSSVNFRKEYGCTILSFLKLNATKKSSDLTTSFNGDMSAVKERFILLADLSKKSKGTKLILTALLLVCIVASLVSCSQQGELVKGVLIKETDDTVSYNFYSDIELILNKKNQMTIELIEKKNDTNSEYTTFTLRDNNTEELDMVVIKLKNSSYTLDKSTQQILNDYRGCFYYSDKYAIYYKVEEMNTSENGSYFPIPDLIREIRFSYKNTEITKENIDDYIDACSLILSNEIDDIVEIDLFKYADVFGSIISAQPVNYYQKIKLPYAYKINDEIIKKCNLTKGYASKYYETDYLIPNIVNTDLSLDEYLESSNRKRYSAIFLTEIYYGAKDTFITIDSDSLEKFEVVYNQEFSRKLDNMKVDYVPDGIKKNYILSDDFNVSILNEVSDSVKLSYDPKNNEVWIYYEHGKEKYKIPMEHRILGEENWTIYDSYVNRGTWQYEHGDGITETVPSVFAQEDTYEYIKDRDSLAWPGGLNFNYKGYRLK